MGQGSEIIKLWIKRDDHRICADKVQSELLGEHIKMFPVLASLGIVTEHRILKEQCYPFRVALYYDDTIDKLLFVRKPLFDFYQGLLKGNRIGEPVNKDSAFSPIIHILQNVSERNLFLKDIYIETHKEAPRFRSIVDSSIWNYLLKDSSSLSDIIREIISNWESHYYDLLIAQEFADLNARLTLESYLYEDPLDSDKTGHSSDVSPFLFHSESNLRSKRLEEEKDESDKGSVYDLKKYQWRVLLVDDRINKSYLKPQEYKVTKEEILKGRIEAMLGPRTCECVYLSDDEESHYSIDSAFDSVNNNLSVVILCVDTIKKAECALKNFKFDFILLDYLLKKSKDEPRRYGYELLYILDNAIGKDNSNLTPLSQYNGGEQYIVGPDHRYFFMFISAFTTAISERLRLSAWSRSEELWHIAEGACPTNTPELFCSNLRKMMLKRIKDSGIENLTPVNILNIVADVFRPAIDGETSVRKRANEKYQDILSLLYHYNRILQDVEMPKSGAGIFTTRGSVLMTSYFQKYINLGGLLEHLVHLIHLTAFGTIRQWPEMWEEYLFFKVQFSDLFEKGNKNLGELFGDIEDYILELKKLN